MKRRIAVLGKNGRLGAAICRVLKADYTIIPLGRSELDLEQPLADQLKSLPFDLLINSAAATNVDWCENNPRLAHRINGTAVAELAAIAAERGVRMIHISTDYVFDGKSKRPYLESDPATPISVYGWAKKAGESALIDVSLNHLAIRVSWIFGPDKPSFVDALLNQAIQHSDAEAIVDKFSTPTYSLDFVEWLRPILFDKPIGGLLHLCNAGECSWHQYAQCAIDVAAGQGIELMTRQIRPIYLSSMKNFVAERPIYSVMNTTRFTSEIGLQPRPWQEAIGDFVRRKFGRDL
jgi:dTDP-4-dehydrorhamnose reductase